MGQNGITYKIFVLKPEDKRPLGRPSPRWEDNIKMDIKGIVGGDANWFPMVQDSEAMKIQVTVFWIVTLCSDVVGYQRSERPCCLRLHGEEERKAAWFSETLVSYHITLASQPRRPLLGSA
jgi:hypothetical protein